jgi:hypothetical protein
MSLEKTSRKYSLGVFWFRRDLRLSDNVGLYHACQECDKVLPIFIFDKNILSSLPSYVDILSALKDRDSSFEPFMSERVIVLFGTMRY